MANFTEAKKRQILEAAQKEPKSAVAKRFKVSLQTIRNWELKESRAPAQVPRVHYAEPDARELQKAKTRVSELENLVIRLIEKLESNGLL
jgi:hypothetical protein